MVKKKRTYSATYFPVYKIWNRRRSKITTALLQSVVHIGAHGSASLRGVRALLDRSTGRKLQPANVRWK